MYKYLTSISKNVYINKLDNIVNKHNNTYHKTIKMKPIKIFFFIKKFFAQYFIRNCSEEDFLIKIFKNTVQWTYVISDLNREIIEMFCKKQLPKKIKKTRKSVKVKK